MSLSEMIFRDISIRLRNITVTNGRSRHAEPYPATRDGPPEVLASPCKPRRHSAGRTFSCRRCLRSLSSRYVFLLSARARKRLLDFLDGDRRAGQLVLSRAAVISNNAQKACGSAPECEAGRSAVRGGKENQADGMDETLELTTRDRMRPCPQVQGRHTG